MRKEVIHCDFCNTPGAHPVGTTTWYGSDAAGDSDYERHELDFCAPCLVALAEALFGLHEMEDRAKLFSRLRQSVGNGALNVNRVRGALKTALEVA